jgi:hypothetical protein
MHVSRDSRRIYGQDVDKLWLHGEVLEVMTHRLDGDRWSTTFVKAKYSSFGNGEQVKVINIAQLKKDNPNPTPEEKQPTASSHENVEQSSIPANNGEAPSLTPTVGPTTTGTAVPHTSKTQASAGLSSTSSSQRPVCSNHSME